MILESVTDLKDDKGKPDFTLLPPEVIRMLLRELVHVWESAEEDSPMLALYGLGDDGLTMELLSQCARVCEHGNKKYSAPISYDPVDAVRKLAYYCTCQNNIDQPSATRSADTPGADCVSSATQSSTQGQEGHLAIQTESQSVENYVARATTDDSGKRIPSTQIGNEGTTRSGKNLIESTLSGGRTRTTENQESWLRPGSRREYANSPHSGLPSRMNSELPKSKTGAVQSVESQRVEGLTSTTTMEQGVSAGSSAAGATKVLVSWETVSKALSEHCSTCFVRRVLFVSGSLLVRSGVDNWRADLGTPGFRMRYRKALLRHLLYYVLKGPLDDDSGLPHLAHAGVNLMFLECDRQKRESAP